ncbi:MAG: ribosomal protein S5-alanine N-acetyltransferase [Synechococcales bacterium]|nr:ribosomal protein S5-alanine N-acetyltransferase [Synechococcales bacterium]
MTVLLETSRLLLRLATQQDIPHLLDYFHANADFHRPFEPIRPEGWLTVAFWRSQVLKNFRQFQQGQALRLFLFDRADNRTVVGMANFTQFYGYPFHACSLGYGLAETAQGQGLMQEALEAGIRYVFTEMHCHRIMASYMPSNQRSAKLLQRLGFQIEGSAKDYLLINGQWQDHILTSLINPAWA